MGPPYPKTVLPAVIVLIGLAVSYFILDDLSYQIGLILSASAMASSLLLCSFAERNLSTTLMIFGSFLRLFGFSVPFAFVATSTLIELTSSRDFAGLAIMAILAICVLYIEAFSLKDRIASLRNYKFRRMLRDDENQDLG